jgi:hypothetical protein
MDNFTFNKEVFTESLNNLKNKLSCKDIYNLILKSYNVNISETNDVKKLISSMCRDSLSFKKRNEKIISDLIDITICLITIKKKNCNENMKKEFIKKINDILVKYR